MGSGVRGRWGGEREKEREKEEGGGREEGGRQEGGKLTGNVRLLLQIHHLLIHAFGRNVFIVLLQGLRRHLRARCPRSVLHVCCMCVACVLHGHCTHSTGNKSLRVRERKEGKEGKEGKEAGWRRGEGLHLLRLEGLELARSDRSGYLDSCMRGIV